MGGTLGTGFGIYIPLMLYVGMIGAALLSVAWRPRLGLYLLIFLIPLQTTRAKLGQFPFGAEIIDIIWLAVFVGVFIRMEGQLIPKSRMTWILILVAAVTYMSLWRGWFYLGGTPPIYISDVRFSDWKNYMVMPVIAIVTASALRDRKQIKIAILLMILGAALVDWSFFRSTAGRDFSHFSYEVRDAGVLGYAGVNGFAAFIAQSIVLCTSMFFFLREKWIKLAICVVVGFSVYCLLFSFSRGGYLACLLGVSFLFLFRQKKLLLGMLVLAIAWQAVLPAAVQERINMTYDKNDQSLDPSAGERVDLWKDAVTLIQQNPVMGAGYDTYQFMHRIGEFGDTHNYYIKVMVEMGAVGLLLLLVLLWQMWRVGMALYRLTDDPLLKGIGLALAGVVLCAAIANLFGDRWTYLQVDGFMWVLVGCAIRGTLIAMDESESGENPEGALEHEAKPDELVAVG